MKNKSRASRLTLEGLKEIKTLKGGMNRGRYSPPFLFLWIRRLRFYNIYIYKYIYIYIKTNKKAEPDSGLASSSEPIVLRNCVTPYFRGSKVKILLKMNNSQVTKALNSLVGTSEAIRLLSMFPSLRLNIKGCRSYIRVSHPENPFPSVTQAIPSGPPPSPTNLIKKGNSCGGGRKSKEWKQWLAGLIDGDGCFQLTKKGYASLEITMDIRDEHALQIIKNVYGGSVKLVSGGRALRYCLRHKKGFLSLVCAV